MNNHKFNFFSSKVLLVFISLCLIPALLYGAKVNKILKAMQKKYRSTSSLRIDFKEKAVFKLTGTESVVSGSLVMKGKNKFRLETEDQLIVNNGETVWRYNKLDNQVLVDYAKPDQQDVVWNTFLYELEEHYYGEIIEEITSTKPKTYVINLVPKPNEQSFFTNIKVWVKDKSWIIERIKYVDYNNNETELEVEKIELNPRLSDETFSFTPPEGIQVVDLRF
ncbi:MAG: outer membrane lipoprotein carrier protein LolA [Calditrichaeota bacterium]|nr:MAG: outer membrane lipoprotein carrier protein LolA [Calditrichota bacterium]